MSETKKVILLGIQCPVYDGIAYGKLFIGVPVENEQEENAKGLQVLSMELDQAAYDAVSLPACPVEAEIDVLNTRGAKNAIRHKCVAIRLSSASPSKSKAA